MDLLTGLLVFWQLLTKKTVELLAYTGSAAAEALQAVKHLCDRMAALLKQRYAARARSVKQSIAQFFTAGWQNFSRPFKKMFRAPRLIAESYRANGFFAAVKTFGRGVKNNRNFFTTIVNYTAPVVGVYFLFTTVTNGINAEYALELTANRQVVGYVASEADFYEAKNSLIARLVDVETDGNEDVVDVSASYQIAKVADAAITQKEEIADTLLSMAASDVVNGYGFYVDGEFLGVLDTVAYVSVLDTMDSLLDNYRTGMVGEQVEFVADIDFIYGLYPTKSVVAPHDINSRLRSNVQEERTYTIEIGDSPIQMANKNGLTYAEFKVMNPGIEELCIAGDEVLIATEQPYLSVKTTYETTYTEEIDYETNYTYDPSQSTDYIKVTKEGVKGSKEVTAVVEMVNGIESARTILATTVTAEPVTAEAIKGTKVTSGYKGSYFNAIKGSGQVDSMIWPVGGNGGYISQYYGNYGHRGLDIAGCGQGTDILAADSGIVVLSGWYYSYGKSVIISHGNGVYTLYAHNSNLYVSVGDQVSQGQAIAGAGSTGNSTGTHLHFEVQINGSTANPLNYIN